MNSDDYYSPDMLEMRREISRLIEKNADAFDACVKEYCRHGPNHFPALECTGGRPTTPDVTLVFLLASYRLAQEKGLTKEAFLHREAQRGVKSGDRFQKVAWYNEETINTQLKKAQKKAKESPEFSDRVEFYQWSLRELQNSEG